MLDCSEVSPRGGETESFGIMPPLLIDSLIDFQIKPILKQICSLCSHLKRLICIVASDFYVTCEPVCIISEVKGKLTEIPNSTEVVYNTSGSAEWLNCLIKCNG